MKNKYKRIVLKLSGEIFGDKEGKGVSIASYMDVAKKISEIKKDNDIDLGIVIGGGNIIRGREANDGEFDMAIAHQMGMVSTIINGLGLQECIEQLGLQTRLMTALRIDAVAEPFLRRKALHHFEKGRIVIFAGGTGNPFFTTDSAAALRACEINADLILKATNVDGIYDKDPNKYPEAKMYKNLSYKEAIEKNLKVMDSTAFAMCWDEKKPIIVFNIKHLDKISKALKGEPFGTLVS